MTIEHDPNTLAIADQLRAKSVTPEVIAGYEMIQTAVSALMVCADQSDAKNYIEIAMSGLMLPFDRAAVHLIRPGGRTPRELQVAAENECGGLRVQLRFAKSDAEDRERALRQREEKNAALHAKLMECAATLAAHIQSSSQYPDFKDDPDWKIADAALRVQP